MVTQRIWVIARPRKRPWQPPGCRGIATFALAKSSCCEQQVATPPLNFGMVTFERDSLAVKGP